MRFSRHDSFLLSSKVNSKIKFCRVKIYLQNLILEKDRFYLPVFNFALLIKKIVTVVEFVGGLVLSVKKTFKNSFP